MFDENIYAELVYDGKTFNVPERLGKPREDQLVGTNQEKLVELACRVCYDSLSSGRDSKSFHENIVKVWHGSTWEHSHLTFNVQSFDWDYPLFVELANKQDIHMEFISNSNIRITINLRHLMEWKSEHLGSQSLFNSFLQSSYNLWSQISSFRNPYPTSDCKCDKNDLRFNSVLVEPKTESEKFVSIFLAGSRGMSHEQVRHRFNISQRSTRYCDESESPWVQHPLMSRYLDENPKDNWTVFQTGNLIRDSRKVYKDIVQKLESWLITDGVDKLTARKQARGVARGFLGNALYTEMIFTASVANWKHMLNMRFSDPADAEIRVMYNPVLRELKKSQYGDCFADYELVPAKDKIGEVCVRN